MRKQEGRTFQIDGYIGMPREELMVIQKPPGSGTWELRGLELTDPQSHS